MALISGPYLHYTTVDCDGIIPGLYVRVRGPLLLCTFSTAAGMGEKKIYEQDAQIMPTNKDVKLQMTNLHLFGFGVFSNVYRGTLLRKEGNKEIAIKKTWPECRRERNFEITFLTGENRRSHKNVIQMLYSFSNKAKDNKVCEAFVFEFMPDTLSTVIRNMDMDQLDIRIYTWQLFSGLHYLSTMEVVHRDIKPVNILVDHSVGQLKIGDFGSAKVITEGMTSTPYQVTRYYRPPELLLNSKSYDWTVDVWSGGCCFGEMLRKRTLLPGKDSKNQLHLVINELGIPNEQDLRAMKVVARFEGESRTGHQFRKLCFKAANDWPEAFALLQRILVYKPKERFSGLKLLTDPFFDELFQQGAVRSNGQPISSIIDRNDIKFAERDEQTRHVYKDKKEERKPLVSVTSNAIKLISCSGSDESTQMQQRRTVMPHSKWSLLTATAKDLIQIKLELSPWLAVVILIVSLPSIAFTFFKLFCLIKEFFKQRLSRKPSVEQAERGAVDRRQSVPRRPSTQNVVSVATIDPKDRGDYLRKPLPIVVPRKSSTSSKMPTTPTAKQTSLEASDPPQKVSACCLHEERLLGLGPMPFDISVVEEEREKELQKLQRAPEEPPVAKILSIARAAQNSGISPGTTPSPSRQST